MSIKDLQQDIPICYVDSEKSCYLIAKSGAEFLSKVQHWKEQVKLYTEIEFFDSYEWQEKNMSFWIAENSMKERIFMASSYYKACKELEICEELIENYWTSEQFDKCFKGYLPLAEQGYSLAECQIGYFYFEGIGIEKIWKKH